jgi:hypothetical protein
MYLFGRDRWGGVVGVASVAAFAFSPYLLYIDPHARGDTPENFAINLAPLMLWTFDRLRRTGSLRHLVFCGVLLAALILSHPLMALVVYTMLLAFLIWETVISPLVPQTYLGPQPRRFIPHLATAIVLGLGLAAFYWLPAGLDRSAIQLRNVAGPGYFDFHNYFVSVTELVSPTRYFDLGATEPRFHYNLGLAQVVMALLGALTVFSGRLRRTDTFFFLFAAVGFVYLMTPASVNFWEAVPLMAFFQFPTRFLGPAALAFAPLAGNAVRWAEQFDWPDGRILTASSATCLAAILYAAMPLFYLPEWNEFGKVDALRMLSIELQGRALGTTSANDFLPAGVALVPGPQKSVLDSYEAGGPIDRVNRATLPAEATVTQLEQKPFYDRYEVNSPSDFVFRVFLFYFPGWTARVDGVEATIEVAQPDGFITFQVPAGKHVVEVGFEETIQRRVAWAISALALIGLVAATVMAARRRGDPLGVLPMPWKTGAVLGAVVLAGFGLKLIADQTGAFRYRSSGNTVQIAQYLYYVKLEREIQLLGYELSNTSPRSGDPFAVTVYWKALAPVPFNYNVYVHLIGPDDQLYAQSDKLNPADFPVSRWPTDKYVRDEHLLVTQKPLIPGEYRVVVGLWRKPSPDSNADTERLRPLTFAETFAEGIVLPTRIVVAP